MTGLSSSEVRSRVEQGLVNEEVDTSTGSIKQIIRENVLTYFNLIFTVLAVLLIVVGSYRDLTFMLIVLINTVIGILQEVKSKQALDNLKFDAMPRVPVYRDGALTEVSSEKLVRDDVIVLSAGSKIPADAEVLEGSVQVNEALITGESDEVEKAPGDGLYSGSYVVSGRCAAQLTAVGAESYINKLTVEATKTGKNDTRSQMVRSLDRMLVVIGFAIIPIGVVLFIQQFHFMEQGFRESVTSMVAAVLGMLPEGLFMMASGAMIVSTVNLARKKVLVQNMRCIETLARVDVLCVDKTGTITENSMKVEEVHLLAEGASEKKVRRLLSDFCANMAPDNITMEAMQEHFTEGTGKKALHVTGFSSKYKYSSATFDDGSFLLGAPEYVLGAQYYNYQEQIDQYGEQGFRVLAYAICENDPLGGPVEGEIYPIALLCLKNPIREAAPPTFEYFRQNDVEIKVISGDNPVTVSRVAEEAGIANAGRYVDARTLETEEDIERCVLDTTVFGRVTPEQKRMIVRALKKKGKTVGMTGDGVNDILAFRDADTSIAMASGSEAASNAAQLVLLDSDFGRMPDVVNEGRRVVGNITKTASLYLTKNIFSLLLAIFSMVSVLRYPLQPSQITLISLFTIGLPSFVLSFEPTREKIKGKFLWQVFKVATPAGITIFLSVSGLLLFGQIMKIDSVSISTAAAGLVALGEFLILARVAKPMNRVHLVMMIVMVSGFLYMLVFHNSFFGIQPMNGKCVMLLILFLFAMEAVFRYFYKFTTLLSMVGSKDGRDEIVRVAKKTFYSTGEDEE